MILSPRLRGEGRQHGKVWDAFPTVTDVFYPLANPPVDVTDYIMAPLQRLVIYLCDKTCNLSDINEARWYLFCQKTRDIENIPPTKAAPLQHTLRAVYQACYIWGQALNCAISNTTRSIGVGMEAGEGGIGAKLDATSAGSDCMCRTYTMWLQEVMPHIMQMCKGSVNMPIWGILLSRLTIIGRNGHNGGGMIRDQLCISNI